jgi:hypothetical protein
LNKNNQFASSFPRRRESSESTFRNAAEVFSLTSLAGLFNQLDSRLRENDELSVY